MLLAGVLPFVIPEHIWDQIPSYLLPFVLVGIAGYVVQKFQEQKIAQHIKEGGQTASWLKALGVCMVSLLVTAGIFFAGAVFVGAVASLDLESEDIQIFVEGPTTVKKDERFEIRATVQNNAETTQTLVDIDVSGEYIKGIVIEGTNPPFSEAELLPFYDDMSYSFDLPIPPGGEVSVVFRAYAASTGDYSGEFEFCINSEMSCLPYPVRTIVR